MSMKSATDRIKQLNPKNISGTIPQALDLIQNLQKSKGNPPMIQAVGVGPLMAMLQFVANKFSNLKQIRDDLLELIKALVELVRINMLQRSPEVEAQIEVIRQRLKTLGKSIDIAQVEALLRQHTKDEVVAILTGNYSAQQR